MSFCLFGYILFRPEPRDNDERPASCTELRLAWIAGLVWTLIEISTRRDVGVCSVRRLPRILAVVACPAASSRKSCRTSAANDTRSMCWSLMSIAISVARGPAVFRSPRLLLNMYTVVDGEALYAGDVAICRRQRARAGSLDIRISYWVPGFYRPGPHVFAGPWTRGENGSRPKRRVPRHAGHSRGPSDVRIAR